MAYVNPTFLQFQQQFARDFPYGSDPTTSVTINDINYAFNTVNVNINPALFASQATYTLGYNLLAAHFLVMNLRSSSQGINGQFNFLQQSKGVSSISEAFAIPETIAQNPMFSMYCKTNYGAMFIQLVYPSLLGNMTNAFGTTLP